MDGLIAEDLGRQRQKNDGKEMDRDGNPYRLAAMLTLEVVL